MVLSSSIVNTVIIALSYILILYTNLRYLQVGIFFVSLLISLVEHKYGEN